MSDILRQPSPKSMCVWQQRVSYSVSINIINTVYSGSANVVQGCGMTSFEKYTKITDTRVLIEKSSKSICSCQNCVTFERLMPHLSTTTYSIYSCCVKKRITRIFTKYAHLGHKNTKNPLKSEMPWISICRRFRKFTLSKTFLFENDFFGRPYS